MARFKVVRDNNNLFSHDYYVVFKDEVGVSIIYAGTFLECRRYMNNQKKRLKKRGSVFVSKRVIG